MVQTIHENKFAKKLENVPLSYDRGYKRIWSMSCDIKEQMIAVIKEWAVQS